MFLFLSKLLPLLIYPLGLASLLLVIALVLAWKSPRWSSIPVAIALLILFVSSNVWVSEQLAKSLEWRHIPKGELPTAEAIVVLGGATKPADPPRPMVDVSERGDRVLYAAQLYNQGKADLVVLSGGRLSWDNEESDQSEAADMAQLLDLMGVPETAILQEPNSLNTYQNAVFVRRLLEPRGINKILLVTSALHMPRSRLIFKKQGFDVIPAPTDFLVAFPTEENVDSSLQATIIDLFPDAGSIDMTTQVIKEYVGTLVYWLKGWL
jgi:uncharacterized SAM-binding protein YcdF (DUF218 family)